MNDNLQNPKPSAGKLKTASGKSAPGGLLASFFATPARFFASLCVAGLLALGFSYGLSHGGFGRPAVQSVSMEEPPDRAEDASSNSTPSDAGHQASETASPDSNENFNNSLQTAPQKGNAPLQVQIVGPADVVSMAQAGPCKISIAWGDGKTANDCQLSHTYARSGTYSIQMAVGNAAAKGAAMPLLLGQTSVEVH